MTRGQASALGERVAVVETKIDSVDAAMKAMGAKLDQILEGQETGRKDRAELRTSIDGLKSDVQKMKPDVEVIADARKVMKVAGWVAALVSAVIGTAWGAWTWIVQHVTWR